MSSFLQKLKKRNIDPKDAEADNQSADPNANQATDAQEVDTGQLNVDIHQTPIAIIIYAQISGANIDDINVLIEGDNDVVTIKGHHTKPSIDVFEVKENESEDVVTECAWGKFYRQVILPSEVDSDTAEANMKEGVLMLRLPLKNAVNTGTRINVRKV